MYTFSSRKGKIEITGNLRLGVRWGYMINTFWKGVVKLPLLAALFSVSVVCWASDSASDPVLFNRDIRPILSDRCYTCHGPDKANRKTAMHFDNEDAARTQLDSGGFAFVGGDLTKSVMYQRITSDDEAIRMPPAYMGYAKLPPHEIDLIKRWIQQGAVWQKHWSLIPPQIALHPQVMHSQWPRDAIDYYVLARLEHEGLTPSPEADRATLIRRVTLDLTGLPPTPAEVDAFLHDTSPNAYEKVVDRLLRSPAMERTWRGSGSMPRATQTPMATRAMVCATCGAGATG
jgi:hypothetical protein